MFQNKSPCCFFINLLTTSFCISVLVGKQGKGRREVNRISKITPPEQYEHMSLTSINIIRGLRRSEESLPSSAECQTGFPVMMNLMARCSEKYTGGPVKYLYIYRQFSMCSLQYSNTGHPSDQSGDIYRSLLSSLLSSNQGLDNFRHGGKFRLKVLLICCVQTND